MIWLFINSSPPQIFYKVRSDYQFFTNQYLSFPILANVGTLNNPVKVEGGGENANITVNFENSNLEFFNQIASDPPLLEEAILYKNDWIVVFKGFISRVNVSLNASLVIEA